MSSGASSGRAPLRMAADPVTIGAAPDVPPKADVAVKPPERAETDAPGAPISGLTMLSSKRGPREDVDASEPASGNELMRIVAPPRIAFASASVIMYAGIVCTPPPKAPANGTLPSINPMMPRMPPAAAMLAIFRLNEQVPRSTSTMRPASSPAVYGVLPAASAQPMDLPPAVGGKNTAPSMGVVIGTDQGWKVAKRVGGVAG